MHFSLLGCVAVRCCVLWCVIILYRCVTMCFSELWCVSTHSCVVTCCSTVVGVAVRNDTAQCLVKCSNTFQCSPVCVTMCFGAPQYHIMRWEVLQRWPEWHKSSWAPKVYLGGVCIDFSLAVMMENWIRGKEGAWVTVLSKGALFLSSALDLTATTWIITSYWGIRDGEKKRITIYN